MALNYFEMFASLRLGVDIEPTTPPESVPHTTLPGYVPTYTVRTEAGEIFFGEFPLDQQVEQMHCAYGEGPLTLHEDEHPVFTVCS